MHSKVSECISIKPFLFAMQSLSIDICWSLAEAESAHAGFCEIGHAHFWVGVCKAVALPVSELLKADSRDRMPGLAINLSGIIGKALVRNSKDRFQYAENLHRPINS